MNFTFTLIFVEGDTEEIFYKRLKEFFFKSSRSKIINLKGLYNINHKILEEVEAKFQQHKNEFFSVCICIDKESRFGKAPINMNMLQNELTFFKVNDVHLFEAIQDIECWFMHDMNSIFKFLKVENSKRIFQKYIPVEKLNHKTLSKLFKENDKEYRKGYASTNFINCLNLDKIITSSAELEKFIMLMNLRTQNLSGKIKQ